VRIGSFLLALSVGLLALTQPVLAQIRPVLLVTFDYPPFMTGQDGLRPTGMMVDVVTEAFRRVGVPFKIELYPVARDLAMIDSGEADAIFSIKKTPEREASYIFSKEPVLTQEYVFFVSRDSRLEFKGDLTALAEASIGVVFKVSFGSVFDMAAKNGVFKTLDAAPSFESNFQKLLAKHVDAVICSRVVGLSIVKQLKASGQVKVSGPPLETTLSYLMFRKGFSPVLVEAFDKAISAMRKDGSYDKIQNAYIR
jgi:polar amino acid transport system substrate-binding protein